MNACPKKILEREVGVFIQKNERDLAVPPIMFWEELEKAYRVPISETQYVTDKIMKYIMRYQLASLGEVSLDSARQGQTDMVRVGREINSLFSILSGGVKQRMEFLIGDVQRRSRQNQAIEKIPTGLRQFDSVLGGGLGRGELGVMLAPTGWGKSFFLVTAGSGALKRRCNVMHVTLELSREKVISRYESFMTRLAKNSLSEVSELVTQKLLRLRRVLQPADVLVIEYPTRGLTVEELRAVIIQTQLGRDFTPDVLLLDYADILQPSWADREKTRYEALMNIYERLRGIAQEFKLAIWTGSQTTRKALSKTIITIQDIAESFGKAQVADVVAAICQTDEEARANKGRFYLDKVRENQSHIIVPFRKNFDISTFTEDVDAHPQEAVPSQVAYETGRSDDVPF